MDRILEYVIPTEYDGKKLLAFLRGGLGMSARTVTKLRHDPGSVLLNGKPVRTVDPVFAGARLCIRLRETGAPVAAEAGEPLQIAYEDADLIVIDKPAGLAMHPTHNHQGDTLANRLSAYLAQKGAAAAFRAVGRLDKTTSGLVICALNRHSASAMQGDYQKTYFAVVEGALTGEGTVDRPIVRPDPGKTLRAVGAGGEPAVTHWTSLAAGNGHTLLRLTLETGRTHQIRVHCASIGHPLAGDEMYGGSRTLIGRAALHCGALAFTHPITGEALNFAAPMPADMRTLVDLINKFLY